MCNYRVAHAFSLGANARVLYLHASCIRGTSVLYIVGRCLSQCRTITSVHHHTAHIVSLSFAFIYLCACMFVLQRASMEKVEADLHMYRQKAGRLLHKRVTVSCLVFYTTFPC